MDQETKKPQDKIIVYTTPTCPYCVTLKAFLDEHNISYEQKDASLPQVQEELLRKSQSLSVPVIDINGKVIIGFARDRICQALGIKE